MKLKVGDRVKLKPTSEYTISLLRKEAGDAPYFVSSMFSVYINIEGSKGTSLGWSSKNFRIEIETLIKEVMDEK